MIFYLTCVPIFFKNGWVAKNHQLELSNETHPHFFLAVRQDGDAELVWLAEEFLFGWLEGAPCDGVVLTPKMIRHPTNLVFRTIL